MTGNGSETQGTRDRKQVDDMAGNGGTKAVIAALLANMAIAALKFVAFTLTASSSMLAEAVHSVADSGNQMLLMVGAKLAKRKANPKHPFGYGRERYIYSFLVAIVLFSVGGLFALFEAFEKWRNPHPIEGTWWWVPLAVLIGAMIAESFSLRTAVRESAKTRKGRNWLEFVRKTKAPELPVILMEDSAALTGLSIAIVGVGLTLITGDSVWDALGSAMIGVLLVIVAAILAVETKSLLLGESATKEHVQKIRDAIADGRANANIVNLKTLHLGPDELLVAAKIAVEPTETGQDIAQQISNAEERIRKAVPFRCTIYLEPDTKGSPAASGDGSKSKKRPIRRQD
jgi:cation diffusion facilitator family transporter